MKVILFSITHFTHDIYTAFLSPLLPIIIERLNLSLLQAGILLPLFRAPSLLQPFIGYHADRGRISRFLPIALVTTALFMSFLTRVHSYAVASILLILTGISAAFFHAPAIYLLGSVSGGRYGTGMSFFMTGGELARSLGPLYLVTLLQFIPEKYLPLAASPGIFFAFLLAFVIHTTRENKNKTSNFPFFALLKRGGKDLLWLIMISILHSFTMFSFTIFLPTYMKLIGFKIFIAGSALTVLEFSGAFGALIGGTISDFMGRRQFLLLSGIGIPIMVNCFLASNSIIYRFLFLLLSGVFMFSVSPVRYAFAQELVPEYKGTISSLLMALSFFTTTLASIITGYLGDHIGLFYTFRIVSVVPITTIPFVLLLKKSTSKNLSI